jgi:hypothetical protein
MLFPSEGCSQVDGEHPVILLAGCTGVGKSSVANRLMASSTKHGLRQNSMIWIIDNKYYTATVCLQEMRLVPDLTVQITTPPPEAAILIIDCQHQSSFDAVSHAWDELCMASQGQEPEIKLFVANKVDQLLTPISIQGAPKETFEEIVRPQWLIDAMEWCTKSGFEYIEACAGGPNVEFDAGLMVSGINNSMKGVNEVTLLCFTHSWKGISMGCPE